jgi:hypothetical protein
MCKWVLQLFIPLTSNIDNFLLFVSIPDASAYSTQAY